VAARAPGKPTFFNPPAPMSYYLLIRGPLGSGKTTVSQRLASILGAEYISLDRILADRRLWEAGRLREFLQADKIAAGRAVKWLAEGTPVIFDGNFYWKTQIKDLIGRLDYPHTVFTLEAPLSVCVARDSRRVPPHGSQATREVFAKSTRFEYGIGIDARPSVYRVVTKILARLPTNPRPVRSRRPRSPETRRSEGSARERPPPNP
jgi:predicted kinase